MFGGAPLAGRWIRRGGRGSNLRPRLQKFKVGQHFCGLLVALLAAFAERLADNGLKRGGDFPPPARERRGLVIEDGDDQVTVCLTREGPAPGDHLVTENSQTEDVAARIDFVAPQLLRDM